MKKLYTKILDKWNNRHQHKWVVLSERKYYGILGNASGHYKLKTLVTCNGCGKIKGDDERR